MSTGMQPRQAFVTSSTAFFSTGTILAPLAPLCTVQLYCAPLCLAFFDVALVSRCALLSVLPCFAQLTFGVL